MSLDRRSHGHLTTAAAADHRVSTQGSAGTQDLSYPTDAKLDKAALWPLLCDGGLIAFSTSSSVRVSKQSQKNGSGRSLRDMSKEDG